MSLQLNAPGIQMKNLFHEVAKIQEDLKNNLESVNTNSLFIVFLKNILDHSFFMTEN